MDHKRTMSNDVLASSCSFAGDQPRHLSRSQPSQQMCSKSFNVDDQTEQSWLESLPPEYPQSLSLNCSINQIVKNATSDWDAKIMLNNLSFLEQKIHQVQDIVRSIICQKSVTSPQPNDLAVRQQLLTTDLTSIIVDLISTAGNLLPSIKNNILSTNPPPEELYSHFVSSTISKPDAILPKSEELPLEKEKDVSDDEELMKSVVDCSGKLYDSLHNEDHDIKDIEDCTEADGSYEVLQLEKEEILAPHTHFCSICGKGFKRDANLRMHMRGHGDEYKTPAALAKPSKDLEPAIIKRYSCPFVGCKRNKEHRSFQPLKTLLCVKNHYKRSHCEKSYICSRCHTKKFSVLADLKTHEKHCGRDKWLCSCGTTFSRKDKLFGHVALFQGHTPALTADEDCVLATLEHGNGKELGIEAEANRCDLTSDSLNDVLDTKIFDDDRTYLSALSFEPNDYGVTDEFMKVAFGLLENSSSLYPPGHFDFVQKYGGNPGSGSFL
ncbi:Zinc finger protein STOP1 like [Apostasia shenzhenica]|uniref:Zinc finger protein STOP1 like n=1 Tax=Apostasia shenzhenica TaxID=1088818 RepID=A0A2H9ZUM0_9ASPA|nr:Zinc finger protein STOP1 like [Apostasia shenzhenica]